MSADELNLLSGHPAPDTPTRGRATRVWAADVVTVHVDGTVDIQPVKSRATKVDVQVPAHYRPTVGDRVLATDLDGDPRTPIVLQPLSTVAPTITGSRAGNVALQHLLTALNAAGIVNDQTTA